MGWVYPLLILVSYMYTSNFVLIGLEHIIPKLNEHGFTTPKKLAQLTLRDMYDVGKFRLLPTPPLSLGPNICVV